MTDNESRDIESLSPVIEGEVTLRGKGEAVVLSADVINIDEGTLKVHGTDQNPIVVNAAGDSIVYAYGNVVVQAREGSRVYGFNNCYVVAAGTCEVQVFDESVVVANDGARAYLNGMSHGYAHGRALMMGSGRSTVIATDESSVSLRDEVTAELRGGATGFAYDTVTVRAMDSSTLNVMSPFVSAGLRNSALAAIGQDSIASALQPYSEGSSDFVFVDPNTGDQVGVIRVSDNARIAGVFEDDAGGEEGTVENDEAVEIEETAPNEPEVAEEAADEEESSGRHSSGGMSVAELLARTRAENEGDAEVEVEPVQIESGHEPAQETSPAENEENGDEVVTPDEISGFSGLDLGASDDEEETVTNSTLEETAEENTTSTPQPNLDTTNLDLEDGVKLLRPAPEGNTAQEQLKLQGWNILTPPTGMMTNVLTQATTETTTTDPTTTTSTSEKEKDPSPTGFQFDLGGEDDEDEDEFKIPGF